ncbi:MAG: efflux RND transporter periplasmic adaptor subunit [Acutalibacteraceae bacterium]|nr:efflux RND transporter periplasmic adaptor subunit [Acutalibacteraceae bacterium]
MMKKIVLEIVITFIVVFGVLLSGSLVKSNVQAVDVYKVTSSTVEDTVICSGKIEYKESCAVSPTTAGIITNIAVKKGEAVNKGDILFSMLTDLNSENISQLNNNSLSELVDNKSINVKAPVSGTILNVNISEDDTVTGAMEVITIVNSRDLCVSLPVSESKISALKVGQNVNITGSAFDDLYKGIISDIDNVAQQVVTTTGKETAVDVVVDILNPDDKIKQGYTAKCTITTNVKDDSCVIPYDTIQIIDENKGEVYLYNNGKVIRKTVNIGNEYKNGVEVLSGINKNDYLITISEDINKANSVKINKLVGNNNV